VISPLTKTRFQRSLSNRLLGALFPDDVSAAILRRLSKFLPDDARLVACSIFQEARLFASSLPICVAQKLLRTWAHGWTTSYHMHENELCCCLFGCDQNDTLQHYLFCPRLWASVDSIVGLAGSSDLLFRLALRTPCVFSACRLYVACSAYHASKGSKFSHFSAWRAAGDLAAIEKCLSQIANTCFVKFCSVPGLGPQKCWHFPFHR